MGFSEAHKILKIENMKRENNIILSTEAVSYTHLTVKTDFHGIQSCGLFLCTKCTGRYPCSD